MTYLLPTKSAIQAVADRLWEIDMSRYFTAFVVFIAFGSSIGAIGYDDPKPAQKLKAVQKEVADAEKLFRDALAKLPDSNQEDPEVEKLYQAYLKKQKAGFATAFEIARTSSDRDTSFLALEWLLLQFAHRDPSGIPVLELMTSQYATDPRIGKAMSFVGYYLPMETDPVYKPVIDLCKAVQARNPDRTAKGHAALALAWDAKNRFRIAESKGSPDAEHLAQIAETAFESVLRDYGTCPNLRDRGARPASATLAGEAESELFELRRLRIGSVAPDIEGLDLAGKTFKLSEQRGKVILLVFWASWCGPCMAEVPHERELVDKFKNRPFAIVGVNGDEKKPEAEKAIAKHSINWRSFWNGKEGPGGPIARAWNVRGWPTVYVIDAKGVIRQKYLRGPRLDSLLEKLVAEAEGDGKSKAKGE
jgi:thiol-disulfide isomerase/thioredoxin